MKRKLTLIFFVSVFCLYVNAIYSQNQITGTVRDGADGSPVPYATAALLHPDSSVVTGVMTNDEGQFVIENVAAGNYLLQVSFIGYEKVYRMVNVPPQSYLGEIRIAEDANLLDEVVITGRRTLVEQRLDRVVVNVSGNMITAGRNINDLLKQMPGLVVDEDGNVKLNGRPATVYIDGRPTNLPAEQVAQMLTGMMGDMIDRVELIDNPSSRYEAGLSSAIVNIRMKRDASLGLNGTLQGGLGFTDYNFASRGGLNLNFRTKTLNIFGNYGYNNVPMNYNLEQTRNFGGTLPITYDQYSLMDQKTPSHTFRAGADWFITPNQTIGFLFNGGHTNLDLKTASQVDVSQTGFSKIDSTILSDALQTATFKSQMYNLNYRLDGDKNGVITVDLDYGNVNNKRWQKIQSRYLNADNSELRSPTEFQYNGPNKIEILSFKLDYAAPLSSNSNLEAGIKTGKTVTDNEIVWENLNEGRWELDPNQSNLFKYTEQISAAFVTYNYRFGNLSAMAGLRAEYTSMKGESPTMDTTFTRHYLDWFPSAYLQYQINERQELNLSYSRKITRPGYFLLNPFRSYSDPFTYSSGNPDLKPSYSNTVALRYSINGYSLNISYNALNDIFSQDYVQDDDNHTMALVQQNIGTRQQTTLSINLPFQIAKWYSLNINPTATYIMADTRYSGDKFQKNYLSAFANLNHNFNFSSSFRANMQMMWMKPTYNGYMLIEDMWGVNIQIEKTLLDNRLNLSLSCNDIFNTLVSIKGTMKLGNVNQTIKQEMNQRQIMLTARYSFGSQQIRAARNRSVGIEEEMGRAR